MIVRALIVEDDPSVRALMVATAQRLCVADGVGDAEAALVRARTGKTDILIVDIGLPGMSGLELIVAIRGFLPHISIVAVSGQATMRMAVTAMKRGAMDFLVKPFRQEVLAAALRTAIERIAAPADVIGASQTPTIVAESAQMRAVLREADMIAPFASTVLIAGETGTGKELIAHRLRVGNRNASGPFVAINCAAIPEALLESELFGHSRGAFTGAVDSRIGRLEEAGTGTLFLDEIGEMSAALQAKLLRALETRTFEPVGSSRSVHLNARVIAATSLDPDEGMRRGLLRPDLYYRLSAVRIDLPPLRDRIDDIRPLAEFLLAQVCKDFGLSSKQLALGTIAALEAYHWPGNVRQLRNCMERSAVLTGTGETILPSHLPRELSTGGGLKPPPPPAQTAEVDESAPSFDQILHGFERRLLLNALERAGGNKLQAARLLGMKRSTYAARLRRLTSAGNHGDDGRTDDPS